MVEIATNDQLPSIASGAAAASPSPAASGADLSWVWKEVRKRVFIKLPFSLAIADALAAATPIILDDDIFVVGFAARDSAMITGIMAPVVKNTIENILRQAAGRHIALEAIEGTTIGDWEETRDRRQKAQLALMAMADQKAAEHHVEDVLNQIVAEIRHRFSQVPDRTLPQVRAGLVLDIAPSLCDAEEMLFGQDALSHDAKRAMTRVIDRIATLLDVPTLTLALEVERYRRTSRRKG